MSSSTAWYLPEGIIQDILSSLPIPCLLRFKSVCKSWHAMITSPNFISHHHNRAITNNEHLILLYKICSSRTILMTVDKTQSYSYDLDLPESVTIVGSSLTIVGSSNGLVCLATIDSYNDIYLWNPATREIRKIPESRRCNKPLLPEFIGFGFDPVTLDFKIVRSVISGQIEVYSKISDSWKVVCNPLSEKVCANQITARAVMKNTLHWPGSIEVSSGNNVNYKGVIMAFDFVNQVFGCMDRPPLSNQSDKRGYQISVFEESQSFFLARSSSIDIWVMKEYGVADSWVKQLSINFFSDIATCPVGCLKMVI